MVGISTILTMATAQPLRPLFLAKSGLFLWILVLPVRVPDLFVATDFLFKLVGGGGGLSVGCFFVFVDLVGSIFLVCKVPVSLGSLAPASTFLVGTVEAR